MTTSEVNVSISSVMKTISAFIKDNNITNQNQILVMDTVHLECLAMNLAKDFGIK